MKRFSTWVSAHPEGAHWKEIFVKTNTGYCAQDVKKLCAADRQPMGEIIKRMIEISKLRQLDGVE